MSRHSCPDCTCTPACEVCADSGYVGKTERGAEWVGLNGETMATVTWTNEPCPNGCLGWVTLSFRDEHPTLNTRGDAP